MSFKALPVTIQQSKNQQGGAHCAPPLPREADRIKDFSKGRGDPRRGNL